MKFINWGKKPTFEKAQAEMCSMSIEEMYSIISRDWMNNDAQTETAS